MKTAEYEIEIGTAVRLYGSPANTRELGIVVGIGMQEGREYYDVRWTGRADIVRALDNTQITPAR